MHPCKGRWLYLSIYGDVKEHVYIVRCKCSRCEIGKTYKGNPVEDSKREHKEQMYIHRRRS